MRGWRQGALCAVTLPAPGVESILVRHGSIGLLVWSQDFKSCGGPVGSAVGSIPTCSRQICWSRRCALGASGAVLDHESTWRSIRKNFVTGLVAILPAGVTIYIVVKVYDFLNGIVEALLPRHIPGLGILLEVIGITLLGALVNNVVGERLVEVVDSIFGRTPLVKGIYEASKQMVTTFLGRSGQASPFRQVVLVPYPQEHSAAIAFIVNEEGLTQDARVGCFVPFSPPTGGALIFFRREQVTPIDMRPEDAMKMVLTGGALAPAPSGPNGSLGRRPGKG